jgi:hypothetical protein
MVTLFMLVGLLPSLLCELPVIPIKVSKETTFITEPLAGDGLPNYALAIQELVKKGVTPEQNGAIPFWQAMGQYEMGDEEYAKLLKEIGVGKDNKIEPLVDLYSEATRETVLEWVLESQQIADEDEVNRVAEQYLDWVWSTPWNKESVAPLARWLLANEQAIDLLVASSTKQQFYSPYPNVLVDPTTAVLEIRIDHAQAMRAAARALMTRTMFHLGNRDLEKAWNDCRAVIKLGNHLVEAPLLVEQLVAIALRKLGTKGALAILSQPDLPQAVAKQIFSDLQNLEQEFDLVSTFDFSERISSLDYSTRLMTNRLGGMPGEKNIENRAINLNIMLQCINEHFDKVVGAAKIKDLRQQSRQMELVDEEFTEESKNIKSFILPGLVSESVRSRHVGVIFFMTGCPAFQAAFKAINHDKQLFELTKTAAALAVYKTEHGRYPKELAALSPSILKEVPNDLYTDKPLHYKPMGDGYLLYSLFENEIDDATDVDGEIRNGEWQADKQEVEREKCDLVIRIPVVLRPKP